MEKIGLLLGSFDPPHIGHVYSACYALNNGMDKVWVVPAWQNPWKTNQTPFDIRFNMCKIMFQNIDDNRITITDFDKHVKSHYTYEGLQKLSTLPIFKRYEFYIIGGTDIVNSINKWKNTEWIQENFKVLGVPRYGYDNNASVGICCSSTEIRNNFKNDKISVPFISNTLNNYINKLNLYK